MENYGAVLQVLSPLPRGREGQGEGVDRLRGWKLEIGGPQHQSNGFISRRALAAGLRDSDTKPGASALRLMNHPVRPP